MSQCLISQDLQSCGEENGTGHMHSFVPREQRELKLTTVRLVREEVQPHFPHPCQACGGPARPGTRAPGTDSPRWTTEHYRNASTVKWGRSLRFKPGPPELNEQWSQEEEQESNHRGSAPSCGGGAGKATGVGTQHRVLGCPVPPGKGPGGGGVLSTRIKLHFPSLPLAPAQDFRTPTVPVWLFSDPFYRGHEKYMHKLTSGKGASPWHS